MFLALRYTTALNTSVIFTLVPSMSGIYAMILVRERLPGAQLAALAVGMIGAIWVIFRGDLDLLLRITSYNVCYTKLLRGLLKIFVELFEIKG